MAVNENGNRLDDSGNVAVDYVWGNFPLQPNDERASNATVDNIGGEDGDYGWAATTQVAAVQLNAALDNHVIATEGRFGFPSFTPAYIGDEDEIANVVVPNVVGLTEAAATAALTAAGLVGEAGDTTTDGADEDNDGLVASTSPAAGANVNFGDTVTYSLYEYVAP